MYPTTHMVTYLHFKSPSYNPFNHKVYLLGLTKFNQSFKTKFNHYILKLNWLLDLIS
jgi:hypothetical protein